MSKLPLSILLLLHLSFSSVPISWIFFLIDREHIPLKHSSPSTRSQIQISAFHNVVLRSPRRSNHHPGSREGGSCQRTSLRPRSQGRGERSWCCKFSFLAIMASILISIPTQSRYQLFEQYNAESGTNVVVVQETCISPLFLLRIGFKLIFSFSSRKDKDQATFEAHFKTDYFQNLGKVIPEEGLLAAPLDLKTIKPVAGFASR